MEMGGDQSIQVNVTASKQMYYTSPESHAPRYLLPTVYLYVAYIANHIVDGPPVLTGCAYVRSNKSTF